MSPLRSYHQEKHERRKRFELLRSWYGEERAEVEMAAHTSRPRSVQDLLTEVMNDELPREWGALLQLRSQWEKITGPHFSRFTFPLSLQNGVLTLAVRHSALLLDLKPSLDLFQKAVTDLIGPQSCREIRLVVGSFPSR